MAHIIKLMDDMSCQLHVFIAHTVFSHSQELVCLLVCEFFLLIEINHHHKSENSDQA